MNPTASPLPEKVRAKVIDSLNERVADALDLYNLAKVAHWNIRGVTFAQLHALFDNVASMASEHADKIAERAVMLGGVAIGTTEQVIKGSALKSRPDGIPNGSDLVRELFESVATYNEGLHDSIGVADDSGDVNTVTLLSDISLAVEKMGWMLSAHMTENQ